MVGATQGAGASMADRGLLVGDDGPMSARVAARLEAMDDLDWVVAHSGEQTQRAVDRGGLAAIVVVEPSAFTDAAATRVAVIVRGDPCPVLAVDGAPSVARAVRSLRAGVADYLELDDVDRLPAAVHEARARRREGAHEAARLQTLGRLVDGVAAEVNNALSVVLAHASLMRADLTDPHPFAEGLDEVLAAARRTAILTRRLHGFGRRRRGAPPQHVDLHALLRDHTPVIRCVLPEDVDLTLDLPGAPPVLLADRAEVEHLMLAAVLFARDASRRPGELLIQTLGQTLDESAAADAALQPGPYVRLVCARVGVRERSTALPDPVREAVVGMRTAVELSRALGGALTIEREASRTTLQILLPLVDAPHARPPTATPIPGRRDHVLLVEGDDHVRAVAATILRRAGFRVLDVATPGQALLVAEQRDVLDLLLTGVVLTRLDGVALAERVRALHPAVAVLFISSHGPPPGPEVPFLAKPFTANTLTGAVTRALHARPPTDLRPG